MEVKKLKTINLYYNNSKYMSYYYKIISKEYEVLQTLKDDQRSLVQIIKIGGDKVVYKVPREKNEKTWQKFLSIFRGSEARREFKICDEIQKLNFLTPTPLLAYERHVNGFYVDSFYIMSYVDAPENQIDYPEEIFEQLKKIHKSGYLHGDSQRENFMLDKDKNIYIIDSKFKKNHFGKFGEFVEYIYLEKSFHRALTTYEKTSFQYKIVKFFYNLKEEIDFIGKKIRGKEATKIKRF